MKRTPSTALVLVLLGACATLRPLHGRCAQASDCQAGQVCMSYGTEVGEGRTCELRCAVDADCPAPLECQRRWDGPPQSCQRPFDPSVSRYSLEPRRSAVDGGP